MKLDRTLSYRLHRLHKLSDLASQQAYETELGLTLGEGRCLAAIGSFANKEGHMSVKELAHFANLDKSQASRSAQLLIDHGLVLKTHSPQDGRSVALKLSPRGMVKYRECVTLIERRNQEIFGVLNLAQRQALSQAFDALLEANDADQKDDFIEV